MKTQRKRNRSLVRASFTAALPIALWAGCATTAHGQFRASIQGTVTDPTGAVIPGATLTLTDKDTNRVLTTTSSGSGTYSFSALAPDHYTIAATAAGFQAQTLTNLQIDPEQVNSVNLKLAVGTDSTTVDVTSTDAATLDTETATLQGSIDSNQIQHLPSAGRDVFQLAQLAPGVFGDGSQSAGGGTNNLPGTQGPGGSGTGIFSTENGPQINGNGGQYETNGITIDGINTSSAVWGGTSVITPSEDSVSTVNIISNAYDAEYGRFSGTQIQVTSKSGTNQIHGSLYFRANRPGLNAYNRYNGPGTFTSGTPAQRGLQRDTLRANQYGGSIGGPIIKDKLFAFFSYETEPQNSISTANGWYETSQFRALAPQGSVAATYLNFPGAAVNVGSYIEETCASAGLIEGTNCHQIVGQGLNIGSPIKTGLKTQDLTWQSTTNPGVGGGLTTVPDIAFYQTNNPTTISARQYNGRMDGDLTKKDHLAFAIYWVPYSSTDFNGPVRGYNLYHHDQINDAYSIIYNHVFSPTLLNEARANDAGWRWNEVTTNPQEPFGLPTAQVDTTGNFQLQFYGAPGPSNFNQHSYEYRDILTKVAGAHSLKFGAELSRLQYLNNPTYSARPSYNFYNIWDFLNDAPHAEAGSFSSVTGTPTTNRQDTRETLIGAFVQDGWKATPHLTLNAGLRYQYFGPYRSKQNNLGVVQLGAGAAEFTGLSIRVGGNLTKTQTANFGPQFGFSFAPPNTHDRVVIRGGYGLNYNQSEIAITGNSGGNPPFVNNINFSQSSIVNGVATIDPRILYATASNTNSLFGYPANPNTVGGYNAANLPTAGGINVVAYQPTEPTIYTQHYSLDTEVDLTHHFIATAGYNGSVTRHLIVQSWLYANGLAQGYAQNPLVSGVQEFGNTGNSNNNSLLLGLKHPMSHHVQFDAEFNYAKSMDTGSGPYYQDPYPYRPDLAYGRSDFNYGKAFKLFGLWQPVFFKKNSLLDKVADGFTLSGIYNVHSGFPFTPYYNTGNPLYYAGSPYSQLRPAAYLNNAGHNTSNNAFENGLANLNFPIAPTGTGLTKTSAYFVNPVAPVATGTGYASGLPQLPGVARNSFNGPGYQDFDGTLSKSFGIPNNRILGENGGLEFRADAFNLFNLKNLNGGAIDANIQDSTFGQTNSGLAGRIINLAVRFSF